MADVLPIRERALARLCEHLDAQVVGAPVGDPIRRAYEFSWSDVQREPLEEADSRQRSAIAILEGSEVVAPGAGYVRKTLSITLDWRYFMIARQSKDTQSSVFNRIIGEITRRVREDRTLGGLIEDVREVGNQPDIDDGNDIQIAGQSFFELVYKHAEDDPAVLSFGAAVPATPSPSVP